MLKGLRQWLIDTYNGLYVIVLQPHMPSYVAVAAVVLALLFGLLWGYGLRPVEYYDGSPHQMSQAARDEWVKLVAGAKYAGMYGDEAIVDLLGRVENPVATVDRLLGGLPDDSILRQGLEQIRPLAEQAGAGRAAPQPGSFFQDILNIVFAVVVVVILALIISPVWRLLIRPNIWDKLYDAVRPKSKEELERRKQEKENRELIKLKKEEEVKLRQDTAAAAATNPYGAPIMQKLSIYTKGRAFDDSFAIEDANDMFLGECGSTIAKHIGDTNDPTAVEVWLFDKDDFVRTLNKLFVSQHAYNDPVIRADLEGRVDDPANDIVLIQPGATIKLETDAILLQAKVLEFKYGDNGILPPNSFFDGLKLQVEAWQKAGGGSKVPAAAPMATPAPVQYAQPPAYTATPLPSAPPPPSIPQQRPSDDDDPFGGTGDFTPVGR